MIRSIASPENQFIKMASSLRQKKNRDETGLFSVEGVRLVREAIASEYTAKFALVSEKETRTQAVAQLVSRLEELGCPVYIATEALFAKISDTETPQGILLVLEQKKQDLLNFAHVEKNAPWIVLDSLQDPGNVGTIIRTADAAGAAGVILAGNCADVYAGKTVRATMGSLFHLPVVKSSVEECLDFCARNYLPLYVAGAEAATDYTTADLSKAFALVMGNEGAGVGTHFRLPASLTLRIPILGRAESLNVASASAVLLFEAARQRQQRVPCKS